MSHTFCFLIAAFFSLFITFASPAFDIRILVNDLPGASPAVGTALVETFKEKGLAVQAITPRELVPNLAGPSREKMLILTECGTLPLSAAKPLEEFIDQGGRLIALGGTLFRDPIGELDGKWVSRKDYDALWAKVPLQCLITDFGPGVQLQGQLDGNTGASKAGAGVALLPPAGDLSGWTRSSNEPSHPSSHDVIMDPTHGTCLHRDIRALDGWDTLNSPPLTQPIPEGQHFTCFWAKGGPRTNRMLFEWQEKDGSRWMGVVELTPQWRRYVLSENDFSFWESVPARKETHLNLANASHFTVGLAATHTGGLWGDQEFWITGIGTCGKTDVPPIDWKVDFKPHEMLYPSYHSYPCKNVESIKVSREQVILNQVDDIQLPKHTFALHPRPQSTGYGKQRTHRWISLLEAKRDYDLAGTIAALRFTQHTEQMWAAFAIQDPNFYTQTPVKNCIIELAKRMQDTLFLWEGGTSKYTYLPSEKVSVGASITAEPRKIEDLTIELCATDPDVYVQPLGDGPDRITKTLWNKDIPFTVGEAKEIPVDQDFPKGEEKPFVRVSLYREGKLIDFIAYHIFEWEPNADLPPVTVEKGDFYIDGKPWFPYGVNYMPSSGIAREEWQPFEQWLGPQGYDPEIVGRDLQRIKNMGMNMVSVFLYYDSLKWGNLIDFLRQCEENDLRVNLSLRPGTPFDFEWDKVREMIETSRLASNKVVFAYDLAWEPHFEGFEDRSRYTKEWNDWIAKKHGDLASAFKAWNFQTDLINGLFPVPQSKQWYECGPWDNMALDYGDFLNDLLHEHYSKARDLVRTIDPNHAVSFRMQYAGDPTYVGPTWIPYDLKGVAKAVDIMEPEGYGRIGSWDNIKAGRFTVDYARAVAPDLPVMWGEAGLHSWDLASMSSTPENEERAAQFYRDYHRMLIDSHSNGISWWWYPGGFRTGENSDYGIINPDGTDRPVTKVIRELGPKVRYQGPRPEPEVIIDLDLRTRPGGLAGIYAKVKDAYWAAIDTGKTVGLRIK